jgi:hypothetical protein
MVLVVFLPSLFPGTANWLPDYVMGPGFKADLSRRARYHGAGWFFVAMGSLKRLKRCVKRLSVRYKPKLPYGGQCARHLAPKDTPSAPACLRP